MSVEAPNPGDITVVHDRDAVLRIMCPMQRKWISVRGKRHSCPWCCYLHKIRMTEWGAKVECKFEDGMPIYDFPIIDRSSKGGPSECHQANQK